MKAVNILSVVDGFNHFLLADVAGQGELHDEAVDIIVFVQFLHLGQ